MNIKKTFSKFIFEKALFDEKKAKDFLIIQLL